MPAPVLKFFTNDDTTEVTSIPWGNVNKGTTGNQPTDPLLYPVHLWNDKGGVAVSDPALQIDITIKSALGDDTGQPVTQRWLGVKSNGFVNDPITDDGDTSFYQVGGEANRYSSSVNKGAFMKDLPSNAAKKIFFELSPPLTSNSGPVSFLTRVTYVF